MLFYNHHKHYRRLIQRSQVQKECKMLDLEIHSKIKMEKFIAEAEHERLINTVLQRRGKRKISFRPIFAWIGNRLRQFGGLFQGRQNEGEIIQPTGLEKPEMLS